MEQKLKSQTTNIKVMAEFRTQEQLEAIAENCNNGNWSDAAKLAESGGFYVSDLINMDAQDLLSEGFKDVAILGEMAQELRETVPPTKEQITTVLKKYVETTFPNGVGSANHFIDSILISNIANDIINL